jgi:murein DD-endopeptidase MepM/ murein hydrolase activator NlpD
MIEWKYKKDSESSSCPIFALPNAKINRLAKVKYQYNENTLSYEKIRKNPWKRMAQASWYALASIVSGVGIYLVFNIVYDSPQERQLQNDKEELLIQYDLMSNRLDQMSTILADLENRDDNIYRTIFEAEPIPDNIRKAGIGGVNRYKNLERFRDESEVVIETSKKLDRLAKQLYIQSKSFDEVIELAKQKEDMLASIPAVQPISNKDLKRMSSGFGKRVHPIYKTVRFHWGNDFTAPVGTDIYCTGKGKVVELEKSRSGYGYHVIIDHGYGYKTLYAHMSKINVKQGQEINRGEVIGLVGNTGLSSAPHLHYEVTKNGHKVNPVNFYFNDLSPEEYDMMIQLSSQENQSFD